MPARKRVRNQQELEALSPREQMALARVFDALSKSRRGTLPLSVQARIAGTTMRTVLRYARPALQRLPNGRYRVKRHDRLYRRIQIVAEGGPVWVDTWDSREASKAAHHLNALRIYGEYGDASVFDPFRGDGVGEATFATDPALLAGMAAAGDLDDFEYYEPIR